MSQTQTTQQYDSIEGETTEGLTRDAVHQLLSSRRRRDTVELLATRGAMDKSALIDAVADREYQGEVGGQQRKRVQVSMHQCHLPKLEEKGVVVDVGGEYHLGSEADELLAYLDVGGSGLLSWALPW